MDPKALDCLFAPTISGAPRSDGLVQFSYINY
ncbi:hypothetical protein [Haladaptatus halobius]